MGKLGRVALEVGRGKRGSAVGGKRGNWGRGVVCSSGGWSGWRRTRLEKEGEEEQCRSRKVGEEHG